MTVVISDELIFLQLKEALLKACDSLLERSEDALDVVAWLEVDGHFGSNVHVAAQHPGDNLAAVLAQVGGPVLGVGVVSAALKFDRHEAPFPALCLQMRTESQEHEFVYPVVFEPGTSAKRRAYEPLQGVGHSSTRSACIH